MIAGNGSLAVIHIASGREWRGGQRQVLYLTEALRRSTRVAQQIVTGHGSRLEEELLTAGLPVHGVTWRAGLSLGALAGLFRVIRRTPGTKPVLHAHDPHALTLGLCAARWFRLPLVVTRRVVFPLRNPWAWRQADRVVAISHAVRRGLESSDVDPDRIVVVPSGIPVPGTPPAPVGLRQSLNLPDTARLIVSVASLTAEKNVALLLHTAALVRDTRPDLWWVLAGEGPERATLQHLSGRLGLEGRVRFLGNVPDGRSIIQEGELYVASSSEEGLNTSVLDAMSLGIPVLVTDAGGLPEAVGAAGVICPSGNAAALAEAIIALLDEAPRREALRRAGREQARGFSADRMAEGMLSVYHSVAPTTWKRNALHLHSQP